MDLLLVVLLLISDFKRKIKNSNEAKRHKKCLPIRLLRPENNLRKENMFAKSLVDDVHDVYSLFGPDCITFLSNDDKARIALGFPLTSFQITNSSPHAFGVQGK